MDKIISLIFESAAVKRVKRTGWQILGDNEESLGDHTFMTAVIAYLLAGEVRKRAAVNMEKVLLMSIFHDFHEARTGDVDKLATFYVTRRTQKANEDIFGGIDDGVLSVLNEYEGKVTIESRIVCEANILALQTELKLLVERGNENANEWYTENGKRLKIPEAKQINNEVWNNNSQIWWKEFRDQLRIQFEK